MLIDVSNHQGAINWQATAPAIQGAYIKTTEGTGFVDGWWRANHDAASSNRIPVGAYHFADLGNPIAEADHFADVYLQAPWQLRPVLDIETNGATANWIRSFRNEFRARTGISRFRVYSSLSLLTGALNPSGWIDADTDIWVAAYRSVLGWTHPQLALWQSTSAATVPGVLGLVDADFYQNGWTPASDTAPAAPVAHPNSEEDMDKWEAGQNVHDVIPCAGRPQFWYLFPTYGRTVYVHQVDYIMPTDDPQRFATIHFDDGSLDASGFHGVNDKTWVFQSDKPGPVPIPTRNGNPGDPQPVGVSIRYSSDEPFRAYCG